MAVRFRIDQTGKPTGTADCSRHDLGPGQPIVLTAIEPPPGPGISYEWEIVDKAYSTAGLTASTGDSVQIGAVGVEPFAYLIECRAFSEGVLVGSVRRVASAKTPGSVRLRLPLFGETADPAARLNNPNVVASTDNALYEDRAGLGASAQNWRGWTELLQELTVAVAAVAAPQGDVAPDEEEPLLTRVKQVQGRAVSAAAPGNGQVLTWDAGDARWEPRDPAVGEDAVTGPGDAEAGNLAMWASSTAVADTDIGAAELNAALDKLAGVEDGAQATSAARVAVALGQLATHVGVNNKKITALAAPDAPTDAANKQFVEDAIAAIDASDTVNESTVRGALGASAGAVSVNNQRVGPAANPASAQDLVTRSYLETQLEALEVPEGAVAGPGSSVIGNLAAWGDIGGDALTDTGLAASAMATKAYADGAAADALSDANAYTDDAIAGLPGGGDVVGPSSSVDGRIALFDGESGDLLKQSADTVASLRQYVDDQIAAIEGGGGGGGDVTWTPVVDANLTTEANQTFVEGTQSWLGLTWRGLNVATCADFFGVVNGTGVVLDHNAVSSDWFLTTNTAPRLYLRCSEIPNFVFGQSRLRVWMHMTAAGVDANFEAAVFGLETIPFASNGRRKLFFFIGQGGHLMCSALDSSTHVGDVSVPNATTARVGMVTLDTKDMSTQWWSKVASASPGDPNSAEFDIDTMRYSAYWRPNANTYLQLDSARSIPAATAENLCVMFGLQTVNTSNTAVATWLRLRIEVSNPSSTSSVVGSDSITNESAASGTTVSDALDGHEDRLDVLAGSMLAAGTTVLDSDPNYVRVTALLHGNGTNGSTQIVDQIGNVWAASGNAQISTSSPKYGSGSIALDGAGDYVSASISGLIGTGDFTVEAWILVNSFATDGAIVCCGPVGNTSQFNLVFEYKNTGALRGSVQNGSGGANVDITSAAGALPTGTWTHVAFTAEGSTARLRVGGAVVASGAITGSRSQAQTSVRIGMLATGLERYFNGWVDDLRITKGLCRYSGAGSITPPAAQHPSAFTVVLVSTQTTTGSNDAQGVASDGTNIYWTNSTTLYKYSQAGSLLASRPTVSDFPVDKSQINGCFYDAGKVYVSAARFTGSTAVSWIVEYDASTLAFIRAHVLPTQAFSEGVTRKYGFWWVCYHADRMVCRFDDSWQLRGTYALSFSITGSSGGYGSSQGYDGITWSGDYLLANIHEIYNEDFVDVYAWDGSGFREVVRLNRPTSSATQGLAIDPVDPTVLWMALRAGSDGFAKVQLV